MVKVDDKSHKVEEYRQKSHQYLDDFIAEENKKGKNFYRELILEDDKEPPEAVYDKDTGDLIMEFEVGINQLDEPIFNVYKREYFDAAKDVAEKIEKEIGVEILLRELYD